MLRYMHALVLGNQHLYILWVPRIWALPFGAAAAKVTETMPLPPVIIGIMVQ